MTGLSDAAVDAIAALASGGELDEDVRPALAAAGIAEVRADAHVGSSETAIWAFLPRARDHIKSSLSALDLADPDVVERVLRFTERIVDVYQASSEADHAKVVRLRNALADDGYSLEMVGGGMVRVSINKRAIAQMMRDMQREFDKHPIRVPVEADPTVALTPGTTIYNGPVIHGNADGAQLAWGNHTVNQVQQVRTEQVAPGFEAIALAVVSTLEGLSAVELAEDDKRDAEAAANEVLAEVTKAEPDRGKLRRALATLKGFLAPVAAGLATGTAKGAEGWARTAIEQLGVPF